MAAQPDGDYISAPNTSVQSVEAVDNVTERLLKFGQMFMSSARYIYRHRCL